LFLSNFVDKQLLWAFPMINNEMNSLVCAVLTIMLPLREVPWMVGMTALKTFFFLPTVEFPIVPI
jgi:hypothetical protein